MTNDRGNLGALVIMGFMTASRRIRAAGCILGFFLLAGGYLLKLRWASDPIGWVGPFFMMAFGVGLIFFWIASTIMAWLMRVAKEDMNER